MMQMSLTRDGDVWHGSADALGTLPLLMANDVAYTGSYAEDALTLTLATDDERNTWAEAPQTIVLTAGTAWSDDLDGQWTVSAFDGTDPSRCTPTPPTSEQTSYTRSYDEHLNALHAQETKFFDGLACLPPRTGTQGVDLFFFAELQGTTLREYAWDYDVNTGIAVEWTVAESDDSATLTKQSCTAADPASMYCGVLPDTITMDEEED